MRATATTIPYVSLIFAMSLAASATALADPTKPVVVENTPDKPVPVDVRNAADDPLYVTAAVRRIPVTCAEVQGLGPNSGQITPVCRRVDNGDLVFPVPSGMTFALTDVLTNRNALIQPGSSFFLSLRSSGGDFRINFSGDQATSPSKHFVTPMVFVREGDSLLVDNGDISASGTLVDVFVSGYLVASDSIGN